MTPIWGWLAARGQVKLLWRDLPLPLQGSWPVQHRAPVAHTDASGWNPLQNCHFCVLFLSFLLWMGISPWQMILCPNCPKVTPSWEISRAVLEGAEPRVKACILISCGLSLLMKWMVVVVGHLTLVVFAVFVSERGQKAQLQQRSWKLQVWAWLENAKLPSVVRLCGDFFCRLFN